MSSPNYIPNNLFDNRRTNRTAEIPFSKNQLATLFYRVDLNKELYRAGIVYIDRNLNVSELRTNCRLDQKSLIIMERPRPSVSSVVKRPIKSISTIGSEVTKVAWSCSSTVITWIAVIGEGALGFETLGTAWSLMPATTAAAIASSATCGVSVGRLINAGTGTAHHNDFLDDEPIYTGLMITLDLVQLAEVARTLGKSAELYKLLRSKQFANQSVIKLYKHMNRAERKRLAGEILKIEHPALAESQKVIKQLINGQRLLPNGQKAIKIYTQIQARSLFNSKVLDLVGSTVTTRGSIHGGSIDLLIGIAE